MNLPKHIVTKSMGCPFCVLRGRRSKFLNYDVFMSLNTILFLLFFDPDNSGLYCLPNYLVIGIQNYLVHVTVNKFLFNHKRSNVVFFAHAILMSVVVPIQRVFYPCFVTVFFLSCSHLTKAGCLTLILVVMFLCGCLCTVSFPRRTVYFSVVCKSGSFLFLFP